MATETPDLGSAIRAARKDLRQVMRYVGDADEQKEAVARAIG